MTTFCSFSLFPECSFQVVMNLLEPSQSTNTLFYISRNRGPRFFPLYRHRSSFPLLPTPSCQCLLCFRMSHSTSAQSSCDTCSRLLLSSPITSCFPSLLSPLPPIPTPCKHVYIAPILKHTSSSK